MTLTAAADGSINLGQLGATGDGTDITDAFYDALRAVPTGGSIVVPPGEHLISAPLDPHPRTGVTVRGSRTTLWPHRFSNQPPEHGEPMCRIRTSPSFVGDAALVLHGRDDPTETPVGSWTVQDIEFSGWGLPRDPVVHGLHTYSDASDLVLSNLVFRSFPGNGWLADQPAHARNAETTHDVFADLVVCFDNLLSGLDLYLTDGELRRLVASGSEHHGFVLRLLANTQFRELQALSNRGTGLWIPPDAVVEAGNHIEIQTDANFRDGVLVEARAAGQGVLNLVQVTTNRDGYLDWKNGTDECAGVRVSNCLVPVVIGHMCAGTMRPYDAPELPRYGLSVESSEYVSVASGAIKGVKASVRDSGARQLRVPRTVLRSRGTHPDTVFQYDAPAIDTISTSPTTEGERV